MNRNCGTVKNEVVKSRLITAYQSNYCEGVINAEGFRHETSHVHSQQDSQPRRRQEQNGHGGCLWPTILVRHGRRLVQGEELWTGRVREKEEKAEATIEKEGPWLFRVPSSTKKLTRLADTSAGKELLRQIGMWRSRLGTDGDYSRSLIKEMQEKHMGLLNVHGRTESPKSCLHTLLPGCWRSPPTASSMSTRYSLLHTAYAQKTHRRGYASGDVSALSGVTP